MRASGKTLGEGGDRFDFLVAAQHATLEFEVLETITSVGGLGQAHHGVGAHGFFS